MGNVPLSYTEFLISPLGPKGVTQLMNYDIIVFSEEGNPKSSHQIELPSLKSGRERPNGGGGGQHLRAGN